MRIISGLLKGRKLKYSVPDGVRPTQDAVKESIFNVLSNMIDIENLVVADIFAGSGSLGIESWSRGASKVFFFEKNRKVMDILEKNVSELKIHKNDIEIIFGDALKKLKQFKNYFPETKFNLIFFDPPYEMMLGNQLPYLLSSLDLIDKKNVIVAETSSFESLIPGDGFEMILDRIYGGSKVHFLTKKFTDLI